MFYRKGVTLMRFFQRIQGLSRPWQARKWLVVILLMILFRPAFFSYADDVISQINPTDTISYQYMPNLPVHVYGHDKNAEVSLPAYKVNHKLYFVVEDLQYLGYDLVFDNTTRTTNMVFQDKPFAKNISPVKKTGKSHPSDVKVYIDGNFVPCYNIGGYSLAPFKYLTRLSHLTVNADIPAITSFTGTLRLPQGEVAPKGGLTGEIFLFSTARADIGFSPDQTIPVKIPAGKSSVSFRYDGELAPATYGLSYRLDSDQYLSAVENTPKFGLQTIPLYKFMLMTDADDYPVDQRHFDIPVVKDFVTLSGSMKLNNVPEFWSKPDTPIAVSSNDPNIPRYLRLKIFQDDTLFMNTLINLPIAKDQTTIDFSIQIPKSNKTYTLNYDMPVFGCFPATNFPLSVGPNWELELLSGTADGIYSATKDQKVNLNYTFPDGLPKDPILSLSRTGKVTVEGRTYTTLSSSEGDLFPLEDFGIFAAPPKDGISYGKQDLLLSRSGSSTRYPHGEDSIRQMMESSAHLTNDSWLNYNLYGLLPVADGKIPVYITNRGLPLIKATDIPKIDWKSIH